MNSTVNLNSPMVKTNPILQMKKIAVATDFSPSSENAVRYAFEMAKHYGTDLILFHSIGVPTFSADMLVNPLDLLEKISRERLEKMAVELKDSLEGEQQPSLTIGTEVRAGFSSENIVTFVEEAKADLLIVGAKRTPHGLSYLLGTTSSEIVRRSNVPVVVVPAAFEGGSIQKMVLAVDLQPISETTLSPLFALAANQDTSLEVLHVIPPKEHFSPSAYDEFKADFVEKCPIENVTFRLFETEKSDIAAAIQDYAEFQEVDLVVMATRSRSFLERVMHPSAAKRVALETKIPAMVLHENDSE